MIAVVYSGSNYADWRLAIRDKTVATFKTQGINPYFSDEKSILALLNKNINLIHHAEEIKKIFFFTAGASSPERIKTVHDALASFFKHAKVYVQHDILAAAIASCRDKKGIVCILGSGSNAAYYDGRKVVPNNYGMGYILGDEGSASWMGKMLLKGFINETLPEKVTKKFTKRYDYDRKQILDKVYRQSQPALFLSSFTEFFNENQEDEYIKNMIITGFKQFIGTYVIPLLKQEPETPVYFVGSVAATFQDQLQQTAADMNINISNIIKEPINNLLKYYSSKN
ncbi:BadF/BadG/BcrA/BcrD ATPase family protein [Mucilaginibacter sp. AW1-3]